MAESKQLDKTAPKFQPEGKIVKSRDFTYWKEGSDYLAAAKEEARNILSQARDEAAQIHKDAYDSALKSADRELAAREVSVASLMDSESAALESDFVDLVLDTTRKIVGDLPATERLSAIAAHAYERFRDERKVTIKVHPDMAEHARASIESVSSETAIQAAVKVIADPSLSTEDCIVQTQRGITRAGLDSQLEVLRRGLSGQFGNQ